MFSNERYSAAFTYFTDFLLEVIQHVGSIEPQKVAETAVISGFTDFYDPLYAPFGVLSVYSPRLHSFQQEFDNSPQLLTKESERLRNGPDKVAHVESGCQEVGFWEEYHGFDDIYRLFTTFIRNLNRFRNTEKWLSPGKVAGPI